jgi:hypothetical protein
MFETVKSLSDERMALARAPMRTDGLLMYCMESSTLSANTIDPLHIVCQRLISFFSFSKDEQLY